MKELFKINIKEIDEIIYSEDKIINSFEIVNKTDKEIVISITSNVPVVRFEERIIKLKPNQEREIKYTILSDLVDTHLEGEAIFTCVLNSNRQENKIKVYLICGK